MRIEKYPSMEIFRTHSAMRNIMDGPIMAQAERIFDDVAGSRQKLFEYTEKFEGHVLGAGTVKVSEAEKEAARRLISREDYQVIEFAARRIRAYHRKQKARGFVFEDGRGTVIEERVVSLDRVGICIPGGRFPLASTVLMTALPAKIAGVREIVMINPWPGGKMNPHVIAAAGIAGVDEIYKVGGVQGVAALAHGLLGEPADKIVGPGSVWVTAGKAIAFARGLAGIDSLAGPSEVAVAADEGALEHAEWIAWDLLSQAEHGDYSKAVLVTTSEKLLQKVHESIQRLIEDRPQDDWIEPAEKRIVGYLLKSGGELAEAVNRIAPEHLEVMVREPEKFVKKIVNAASIFIGPYSPVPAGDYMAGGNHVLPTGGTARFSSPLGVYDFVKRQSITTLSREGLETIAHPTARFAEIEGLKAHSLAVSERIKPPRHQDPKNTEKKNKKSSPRKAGK